MYGEQNRTRKRVRKHRMSEMEALVASRTIDCPPIIRSPRNMITGRREKKKASTIGPRPARFSPSISYDNRGTSFDMTE